MAQTAALHATVRGFVQGVNYRYFVLRQAGALGLTGYARNLRDGSVEVVAEGDRDKLEQLLSQLRVGPRSAHVGSVDANWSECTGDYRGFDIRY